MPCVFDQAMKPQTAPSRITPTIHDGCNHSGFGGMYSSNALTEDSAHHG